MAAGSLPLAEVETLAAALGGVARSVLTHGELPLAEAEVLLLGAGLDGEAERAELQRWSKLLATVRGGADAALCERVVEGLRMRGLGEAAARLAVGLVAGPQPSSAAAGAPSLAPITVTVETISFGVLAPGRAAQQELLVSGGPGEVAAWPEGRVAAHPRRFGPGETVVRVTVAAGAAGELVLGQVRLWNASEDVVVEVVAEWTSPATVVEEPVRGAAPSLVPAVTESVPAQRNPRRRRPEPAPAEPLALPDYLRRWVAQMPLIRQLRVAAIDDMPQVLIPAGEFLMGSPEGVGRADEHPQKQVFVSAFWIDLHPVTVGQYRRYCVATQRPMPDPPAWGWQLHHPVVNVSWQEAAAYADWVGRQLPSEAQWEKAARGGTTTAYPWGRAWDPRQANGREGGPGQPTPVGSYPPNALGVFDTVGNVREWCRDVYEAAWYRRMPLGDPLNTGPLATTSAGGLGSSGGMAGVLRGSSWHCPPIDCRVARRGQAGADQRGDGVGFRASWAVL